MVYLWDHGTLLPDYGSMYFLCKLCKRSCRGRYCWRQCSMVRLRLNPTVYVYSDICLFYYSATSSTCATETIFLQYPSVSPLSHIICVPPGYQPRTAYHELNLGASTTTSPTSTTCMNCRSGIFLNYTDI